MTEPRPIEERRNAVAAAVADAWGGYVPLSVRYAAADAADRLVVAWQDQLPKPPDTGDALGTDQGGALTRCSYCARWTDRAGGVCSTCAEAGG